MKTATPSALRANRAIRRRRLEEAADIMRMKMEGNRIAARRGIRLPHPDVMDPHLVAAYDHHRHGNSVRQFGKATLRAWMQA